MQSIRLVKGSFGGTSNTGYTRKRRMVYFISRSWLEHAVSRAYIAEGRDGSLGTWFWLGDDDMIPCLARSLLTQDLAGNIELLETITSHPQVLPSRRRSKCTTTGEFYEWFLGGRSGPIRTVSIN